MTLKVVQFDNESGNHSNELHSENMEHILVTLVVLNDIVGNTHNDLHPQNIFPYR